MGEFHLSRYPAADWREELLKIRAGGIDLVATYLFWNHHEEERGTLRFDGGLDIRRFTGLCGELGLYVAVRIGPWSHGECRNGGFPDWLQETGCASRTDDPAYLALVEPYYTRISHELRGLGHDGGGPATVEWPSSVTGPSAVSRISSASCRAAVSTGTRARLSAAVRCGGAVPPPEDAYGHVGLGEFPGRVT
ncbi:hypothetical protein GCM10010145_60220 [Streptomyces ruber]|uniref:Glycoside hydrolase 35 catalytic domain-containing protein n=2 Tax=Streptomyces TaxID=1883 RepID=A0A918BNK3_9ACTN|nr:beta-galactosidase [Streptomyces ruber]GGQ82407.1 hypothetical protein GCM10010145_60220 [Streptomyces ruber]